MFVRWLEVSVDSRDGLATRRTHVMGPGSCWRRVASDDDGCWIIAEGAAKPRSVDWVRRNHTLSTMARGLDREDEPPAKTRFLQRLRRAVAPPGLRRRPTRPVPRNLFPAKFGSNRISPFAA